MDGQYQQAMIQALLGGVAQPGLLQTAQNPNSTYGRNFVTGQPTAIGGMQGPNAYQPINPNMPQNGTPMGGPMMPQQQMQQPYQQYPGTGGPLFSGQGMGGGNQGQ